MKLANRIFLFFGALSVISFVQFDAMGDDAAQGCKTVAAGKYCLKKSKEHNCPAGCYCDGGKDSPAVANIGGLPSDMAVRYACAMQDSTKENQLSNAGVHYCGAGKTSPRGSDNDSDCKNGKTAYDGSNNCTGTVNEGHYCKNKDNHNKCPAGCYCTGNKNAVGSQWWNGTSWQGILVETWCNGHKRSFLTSYLNDRGIFYCPEAFPDSDKGADEEDDCYFTVNSIKVYKKNKYAIDGGYYFPKGTITQEACECEGGTQCYCPGEQDVSASFTQAVGRKICPSNKVSNSSKTDCVCPNGTKWDDVLGACVSRYTVTYDCNGGTGNAPEDEHSPYLVGATVALKSNTCTASSGRTFDKWDCGDSIGDMTTTQTFFMPPANVTCTANWKNANPNSVLCEAGQYLPANRSTCVQCQDGYGCSGGTFTVKNYIQGREQCMPDRVSCQNHSACCYCPDGSNPNDTYSDCVNSNGGVVTPEDPVSCTTPGEYLKNGVCADCESDYFCPGDGYEYRCPLSLSQTSTGASCKGNVSKTQMYGNNCWKYTGVSRASDYRDCVYGDHLESYPH